MSNFDNLMIFTKICKVNAKHCKKVYDSVKFPCLEVNSHILLVTSLLKAVKKIFNLIFLIFSWNPPCSLPQKSCITVVRAEN